MGTDELEAFIELDSNVEKEVAVPSEIIESIKIKKDVEIAPVKVKRGKGQSEEVEQEVLDLYGEFSNFLENSTGIHLHQDSGVKHVIPTGIDVMDTVLGGGFAVGSLGIVVGAPGCGKTMLSIQTMGQAQLKYKGAMVHFLDAEEATTILRLSNLGVRYPKIKPYNDMTVEKVFKFIEGLCLFKEKAGIIDVPSIVVWDSIANTLSEKERESEDPDKVIGYKARVLSILTPKYVAKLSKYNICLLAVNQLRDKISMGQFTPSADLKFLSHTKNMPGGQVIKYNANQLVEMKISAKLDSEKDYGFDGFVATAKCVKNKLFSPNVDVELVGNFVTGFNNFWTNYRFLANTKRIKTGPWNQFMEDSEARKWRTKDSEEKYNTEEWFKEHFDSALKEALQTELIDKHNPEL